MFGSETAPWEVARKICTLRRLSMNQAQRTSKSLRSGTVLALAVVLLAVGETAIPAQAQTYTDLHDFNPSAGDPQQLLYTDLFPQGRDGQLYGVSHTGGTAGLGTVFSITLGGTPTVLHSFDGSSTGSNPYNGLTLGGDGNFYGVAPFGGSAGLGNVYKITPTGTVTVLHNFTNTGDGDGPTSPPTQGSDGNFYGTTGGSGGVSVFYKVTPTGTFKTLHTFTSAEGVECGYAALGTDGNFYGGCTQGGTNNDGTLFKVSATGHLTVLHNMTGTDGKAPAGPELMQASDGNFYGVTLFGGTHNVGVFYKLKTSGTYTVLYNFTGGSDGGNPVAAPTQGPDGNLYGTASIGGNTVACSGDGTHGSAPESWLTLDTDGVFYGNTFGGGAHGDGVFYSFNVGFSPFVTLGITSGKVGTKVGIMGQGFDSSSVVKFGGVAATSITLYGNDVQHRHSTGGSGGRLCDRDHRLNHADQHEDLYSPRFLEQRRGHADGPHRNLHGSDRDKYLCHRWHSRRRRDRWRQRNLQHQDEQVDHRHCRSERALGGRFRRGQWNLVPFRGQQRVGYHQPRRSLQPRHQDLVDKGFHAYRQTGRCCCG
jgi:uncharacterized repeat protein (TIGR03803 family)